MRREWIEMSTLGGIILILLSPSMRREWIEIQRSLRSILERRVSLHAEGVD